MGHCNTALFLKQSRAKWNWNAARCSGVDVLPFLMSDGRIGDEKHNVKKSHSSASFSSSRLLFAPCSPTVSCSLSFQCHQRMQGGCKNLQPHIPPPLFFFLSSSPTFSYQKYNMMGSNSNPHGFG